MNDKKLRCTECKAELNIGDDVYFNSRYICTNDKDIYCSGECVEEQYFGDRCWYSEVLTEELMNEYQ